MTGSPEQEANRYERVANSLTNSLEEVTTPFLPELLIDPCDDLGK